MNVLRRAYHVPAVVEFAGKADVVVEIAERVGFAALQIHDACDLPAFQHLAFRF